MFAVCLYIVHSYVWTSFFLVCSFICIVFICLSFLTCCVWDLLFPGFKESWILSLKKVEFFASLVSALLKLVQWFVWASHRVRFMLIEILFVCFACDWQGREVVILSADDWVCIVLFFRWGVLHGVLLVVSWCWILHSSGFLCMSSHYLILPRVSSLIF